MGPFKISSSAPIVIGDLVEYKKINEVITVTNSPYDVLVTDSILLVDTADGDVTINLDTVENATNDGKILTIKDASGNFVNAFCALATAYNIDDFVPTFKLTNNYECTTIMWDNTNLLWRILSRYIPV